MNAKQTAQRIYDQMHQTPLTRLIEVYGENELRKQQPIQFATVDEIAAHIQMVEDVSSKMGTMLSYDKFPYGTTREQVVAAAESKIKTNKRRAGVRALQAKYGNEAAERIVEKYAGRHISLKH